jgi:hypothetical protein
MTLKLPRVAFWLMPEPEMCCRLQPVIDDLAGRFAAPPFTPHVTLYTCQRSLDQSELIQLIRVAQATRPLSLAAVGLATGERLAQTLFLRLQTEAAISTLHHALHAGVAQPSSYLLDPHLSLLYQKLSTATRTTLIEELKLPVTNLHCDTLQAVAIPERLDDMAAFVGWKTLISVRLAG